MGAITLQEDVTALEHAQEQLRAAVRDREQLLAVVSHDLRNPLDVIASYSHFLLEDSSKPLDDERRIRLVEHEQSRHGVGDRARLVEGVGVHAGAKGGKDLELGPRALQCMLAAWAADDDVA